MTAITITEFSTEDVISNLGSGTATRKMVVYLRGTSTATYTLDLSSTMSNIADIQGVVYDTYDNAVAVTATTWSTTTITLKDNAAYEGAFLVTLT